MVRAKTRWTLRTARSDEAESIAALHTASWRRTYRGMMADDFLDGRHSTIAGASGVSA
jgi:hypothetical protein